MPALARVIASICYLAFISPLAEAKGMRVIAVGDMAKCDFSFGEKLKLWTGGLSKSSYDRFPTSGVAKAIADHGHDLLILVGDLAYNRGSKGDFKNCFDPIWGDLVKGAFAVAGNHEYKKGNATPYLAYAKKNDILTGDNGYFSANRGDWHIIGLNTNLDGSEMQLQIDWLREDLAQVQNPCILAFGHHPRFSSGGHGDNDHVGPLYRLLEEANVSLYLAGHDHGFEAFAPMTNDSRVDAAKGIEGIIVGTGGYTSMHPFTKIRDGSRAQIAEVYGFLSLTLMPTSYEWAFIDTKGKERIAGERACVR